MSTERLGPKPKLGAWLRLAIVLSLVWLPTSCFYWLEQRSHQAAQLAELGRASCETSAATRGRPTDADTCWKRWPHDYDKSYAGALEEAAIVSVLTLAFLWFAVSAAIAVARWVLAGRGT